MVKEMIGMAAVLLIFGMMPLVVGIVLFKIKASRLDALVKLAELGTNVDADMVKLLGEGAASNKTDYKWGLMWLAIGIPVTLGLWVNAGSDPAIWGLIPVFLGIAFLISGKLQLRGPSWGNELQD